MNIGVNLVAFLPGVSGGIELYSRNLLSSLAAIDDSNNYFLFTNRHNHSVFDFKRPNFRCVLSSISPRPQVFRVVWEQFYLPLLARRLHLDVMHSLSYTIPVFSTVPHVVTICDMLYKTHPQTLSASKRMFWRLLVPISAKLSKRVLTISANSKLEIVKHLHISADKVIVTPLALDMYFESLGKPTELQILSVCAKYKIPRPYILSVGVLGKHKNGAAILKALAVLRSRYQETRLKAVLVGNDYGAKWEIESLAESLGLNGCVHRLGYVARQDLPALYAGALAYVSVSYYEGFGLTLLEAMACRTPVIASDRASLPEVAGDGAVIVDADNPSQLAEAIYTLATDADCRAKIAERGYDRTREFSWVRTAELTLAAYKAAINGSIL